jgi:primosomal protein N' (replication factor Y) (superfamily II helicase)
MHHYEVWVSSSKYHGEKPLTYSSENSLNIGSVVVVPMQKQTVVAVITRKVTKPAFATKDILRIVSDAALPTELIQLVEWLREYYPAPMGQITSLLLPSSLTAQSRKTTEKAPSTKPFSLPKLTKDQTLALQAIHDANPKSVMLHGDTGTGKTRVYMELIREQLARGRSSIVLTPEIGLTPQLALTCQEAFPDKSVVIHSGLTPAQRRNAWMKVIQSAEPLIVIGPRSALFAPLANIGLIVIDEFHETSYKQEQAPHYLATRVAAKLAELHKAQLILGSATPPISDYFAFKEKGLPIVRMKEPAVKNVGSEPITEIIDLRKRELFTRSPWVSDQLLKALEVSLLNSQQSLVFLNRRGTAKLVLCQNCGWEALCPRCDLPLTYHGDKHIMQCHTCGYHEAVPLACPDCSETNIIFRSIGTKSLVTELERLLPKARIGRFDSDTAKPDRLEQQYASILEGKLDILVGTQMLGKGLDLPNLSTLGIVLADTSLTFPDYTSEERTYQLLTQALGRVHRGHVLGSAFIQTYHPENKVLNTAVSNDYESFYSNQAEERKLFGFPPYRYMLKLTCSRSSSQTAQKASQQLGATLRSQKLPIEVIGPSPAFTEKIHNRYRWQLIIKATQRTELIKIIRSLPANWSYDIDPVNLL